ncbi:MAG: four helix bundle protein [Bacteroidota bacterium]
MGKVYDLEDRTLRFAQDTIAYVNRLPRTITNLEIAHQLAKSGPSVGANYREANDALGRKDFFMHLRISRKEAKESAYWFQLSQPLPGQDTERVRLVDEATQLMKIFGSIISRAEHGTPKKLE